MTLTRLQQIAGGSVPIAIRPSEGAPETRIAEVGSEKVRACVELVEQALGNKRRVVIFARFRDEIRRLTGAFPHHYRDTEGRCFYCHKPIRAALHLKPSKDSYVGVIMGGVDADKRDELITRLNSGSVKVLIIQIQAGSESVDLTAASVAIFFSTGYSLREFLQARGRIYRHGQKQRVNEYFLQVKRSIDEPIFKALNNKQSIARKVTRLGYAKSLISGRRNAKQ
jgi:ERCC4-related helicase